MSDVLDAGAYLHHLEIQSADPARLADFYARAVQMRSERMGADRFVLRGPGRRMLFVQGRNKGLGFAAFGCRDAFACERLRMQLSSRGIEIMASPSPLFDPSAFAVRDPEGNILVFGMAPEDATAPRALRGPLQHVTLTSTDLGPMEDFYIGKLGFAPSDRVRNEEGKLTTVFVRSNHEHHTVGLFLKAEAGLDHHSYEAGEWITIRDWADHFGSLRIPIVWGPGRHGPGNNLFAFIKDPDGNMVEFSAELEVIHDRPVAEWKHEPFTLNMWGPAIMRS